MDRITVYPHEARRMILDGTAPAGMYVDGALDLYDCKALTALPDGLAVGGWLDLSRCTALTALPEGLTVGETLDLTGCTSLTALPRRITACGHTGRMIAHSDYPLIWDGSRYHAGCRHFTTAEALDHWGDAQRTDARARIFHAAIRAHQKEITA